mmetsp:Transcript_22836/g.36465  ORF Transcript_22836/g.36465 Transcript_22836/m.36465 type:complete len:417 (+) Transcript_22836:39-1289(+)
MSPFSLICYSIISMLSCIAHSSDWSVICQNMQNETSTPYSLHHDSIANSELSSRNYTIRNISIPVGATDSSSNQTCYFYLSYNASASFAQDSDCTFSVQLQDASNSSDSTSDLDELRLHHIFNVNEDNILWRTIINVSATTNSTDYWLQIAPQCDTIDTVNNSAFFASQNITGRQVTPSALLGAFSEPTWHTYSSHNVSSADNELFVFPASFSVSNDALSDESSVDIEFGGMHDVTCYFEAAFETQGDAENSSLSNGLEYYLLPTSVSAAELLMDVVITRECMAIINSTMDNDTDTDTDTHLNFSSTLAISSTMAEMVTTAEPTVFGVDLRVIIAIAVVAAIILCASIAVVVWLMQRKNLWQNEQDQDEKVEMVSSKKLKGPAEYETHDAFRVTEADHEEMLQLQKQNSLSTGLQT